MIASTLSSFCALALATAVAQRPPRIVPRPVVSTEVIARWDFDAADGGGWTAAHDAEVATRDGALQVTSLGGDPYLHGPRLASARASATRGTSELLLVLRARFETAGGGQVFWTSRDGPTWSEARSARFPLEHDARWHECAVELGVVGELTQLRLDPGAAPGVVEIDWIELRRRELHPLEIVAVEVGGARVRVTVENHAARPSVCYVNGRRASIAAAASQVVELPRRGSAAFAPFAIEVEAEGLAPLRREIYVHDRDREADWVRRRSGGVELRCARDGSGARVLLDGRSVAVLAPLARRLDAAPAGPLELAERGARIELANDRVAVTLELEDGRLRYRLDARDGGAWEGPVVRALGPLEQALFCGLEYLGEGERSSSTLDVETAAHARFAPDPLLVTMPLIACAVQGATVALTWNDMDLQPTFAAPNFVDGAPDHRMALRGAAIDAEVVVRPGRLEDAILEAVARRGLPPLPAAPRDPDAQRRLCLAALNGPLRSADGWGHCAEPRWTRAPFADHAATVFRLTGAVPELPRLVSGGSHIRNDAAFFLTGRAREWLAAQHQEAERLLRAQRDDGSFGYEGEYARGHFEDTASGYCAQRTLRLLEVARATGDADALAGGMRGLERLLAFRTPRGAQTWEVPLHTPDILASAYLVWANVRGFELTGRDGYLDEAVRWAASGLPFVYQWSRHPTMAYATVPVYGATNWRAPEWFGLPVQWCGLPYAYALGLLARHDDALDWSGVARGILIAAERMQYPDGDLAGCLPDVFQLAAQARAGPSINPCAIVSLERLLDGEPDGLAIATGGGHRVVSPFPVRIEDGRAIVEARSGVRYQLLIDGARVVDVESNGRDALRL